MRHLFTRVLLSGRSVVTPWLAGLALAACSGGATGTGADPGAGGLLSNAGGPGGGVQTGGVQTGGVMQTGGAGANGSGGNAGSISIGGNAVTGGGDSGGAGGSGGLASAGMGATSGSGGTAGAAAGGAMGHCLASTAELPTMKGLRDSDYYQDTGAPQGTIADVDFAWDKSKNPASGPPQKSQQAVSPEVPEGYERMRVYTPPGYDPKGTTRYPVLYLNHGTGDSYKVWLATSAGTGNVDRNPGYGARIYENLLAKRAAVPMIIVTPYIDDCGPLNAPTATNIKDDYGCTPKFKTAIIPKIDATYLTIADRAGRAMAGLSRGGYVTLQSGFPNIDSLFSEFYVYSAAYGASVASDLTGYMKALGNLATNSSQTNAWLNQPLYIAIGSGDTVVNGSAESMNMQLTTAGIKTLHVVTDGSHEWGNWRRYLHQSLQVMFTNPQGCR